MSSIIKIVFEYRMLKKILTEALILRKEFKNTCKLLKIKQLHIIRKALDTHIVHWQIS